jgi:hypothetical protein
MIIDTTFDFRADTPPGKDPDSHSPTLRRYHQLLWSKPLPSGVLFELETTTPGYYLLHRAELGQFELSSDAVMASYTRHIAMAPIIAHFSEEEHAAFNTLGYTIGGMMVFPSNRVDGKITINGARGFLRRIADRMDLTLESIRRHYRGEPSPLGATLARYASFFALFDDFGGYVDFFLLQDLVTADGRGVRFFMPFDDFNPPAMPRDVETYREFRRLSIEFIQARNQRIDALFNRAPDPVGVYPTAAFPTIV